MVRSGARGYITKNSSKEEIFKAIQEVAKGNKYICNEIKNLFSDEVLGERELPSGAELLTGREIQIIQHISGGLSSKDIARDCNIAVKTVEVHPYNILKKHQLKNASGLVEFFYQNAGYFANA